MSYERRKTKVGKVVSSKMDKTLVVSVEWRSPHRVYKKNVRKWSRFKVHDENNIGNLGDTVLITESKPYSKTKKWKLSEILQKGDVADLQPTDIVVNGFDDSGKEVSLPHIHCRRTSCVGEEKYYTLYLRRLKIPIDFL